MPVSVTWTRCVLLFNIGLAETSKEQTEARMAARESTTAKASLAQDPPVFDGDGSRRVSNLSARLTRGITRNHDFFGQQRMLKQMDDVLLPKEDGQSVLRSFALCGMGGMGVIGKTELAIEYVLSR